MNKSHAAIVLGASFIISLFVGASVALANVSVVSSDPSYATSFQFFCPPYARSFESAKHYVPDGSPCNYSIPSTLSGSKIIGLYEGTVGNSALVSGDLVSFSGTLVQELSQGFGSQAQDQNYFAVVYDSSLASGPNPIEDYFTGATTTLPSGATLNQSYYVLPWQWGGKPASEYTPVVVVPDTTMSWPTSGGVVVDPIFHTYQNLLDTFTASGYILGTNLFVFPYNWEQSNTTSANALATFIQSIKTTCACGHVDIVAHGTGGLVAGQYIETASQSDVDQLVLLGTPVLGVPAAYLGWEGGAINFGSPLADGLTQVFLAAQAKDAGLSSVFSYVQQSVPSLREMLPINDYLYDAGLVERFYPTGYPQNTFLENFLSSYSSGVLGKGVRVSSLIADNGLSNTTNSFMVGASTHAPLWSDGEPTSVFANVGDGMVPQANIENFLSTTELVGGTHRALPTLSEASVFNILNNKAPTTAANTAYTVSCALFISATAGADMQVTDPNGKRLGKDFTNNGTFSEIPASLYSGFSNPTEYAIVTNPVTGVYQIKTQGTGAGSFTINASDVCPSGVVSTSTQATATSGQLIGLALTVTTSTQTLNLQVLDQNPPVVTINNPANNSTVFQNSTTTINVLVVDPENSPIATTTYRFNGALVNPAVPLLFSTLGTSTLVVSAKDVFGNTGYATSSFLVKVKPPTADTTPPVITITSPLKYGVYERTDVVHLTATITDQSAIATSTYWFNNKKINPASTLVFNSSTPLIDTVAVSAKDSAGNIATSTLSFIVVKSKSSCLLDIIAVLLAYQQDKTIPDKPTIENLVADCTALLKGYHRYDWH